MKHVFSLSSIALILSVLTNSPAAEAGKLVIVTDQRSGAKAHQIRQLIARTLPFSMLRAEEFTSEVQILDASEPRISCQPRRIQYSDREIEGLQAANRRAGIPELTSEQIRTYRVGYTINRLVECDTTALAGLAVRFQADHMIFVRDGAFEGGSGGNIPVILSGSRVGIGLHEWLHTFGLADEYAYGANEANFYCQPGRRWPNIAIFNDQPPYANSADVRARHGADIPWLPYLGPSAVLVNGDQLGSPLLSGNVGLYRSASCNEAIPAMKSWRPSSRVTVMGSPETNYIPKAYWPAILSGLGVSAERMSTLMQATVRPEWLPRTPRSSIRSPPAGSI